MFWDIDSATEIRTVTLEDFPLDMEINAYEISSDGSMLAVSEDRGQVFVWDLATGRRRGNPADRPGAARGIAFAPGTATLVIAAATGEMTLYDLATEQAVGDPLRAHGAGAGYVAFSADGRYLASVGNDGLVAWWGDNTGPGLITQPIAAPHTTDPDYSGDGSRLLVDAAGHPEIRNGLHPERPGSDVTPVEFAGRPLSIDDLSADGSTALLMATDYPHTLIAVDAGTGRTLWSMPDPDNFIGERAVSPDGRFVAAETPGDPSRLRLWNVRSGEQVAEFDAADSPGDPHAHAVTATITGGPTFSADGRYVYVYVTPTVLRLDASDLGVVSYANSPVIIWGSIAEVPGTDDVIGAGWGGRIFRWDMASGGIVASGRSPDASRLTRTAVSADGSLVAAYHDFSSRLALFDAATLRPIGRPLPVSDNSFRPQFTPDGKHLTGNGIHNGAATLWTLDPEVWLSTACHAAGRNLTQAEWVEYLGPDEPYRPTCPGWPPGE
jgi:WD40 repeat protein